MINRYIYRDRQRERQTERDRDRERQIDRERERERERIKGNELNSTPSTNLPSTATTHKSQGLRQVWAIITSVKFLERLKSS